MGANPGGDAMGERNTGGTVVSGLREAFADDGEQGVLFEVVPGPGELGEAEGGGDDGAEGSRARGRRSPVLGPHACARCAGYVAVVDVFGAGVGMGREVACIACGWSQDLDRDGYLVEPPDEQELRGMRGPHRRIRHPVLADAPEDGIPRCGASLMDGARCRQIVKAGERCGRHRP